MFYIYGEFLHTDFTTVETASSLIDSTVLSTSLGNLLASNATDKATAI